MKTSIFTLGMIMTTGAFAQAPEAEAPHTPTTAQEWFNGKDVNQDGFLVPEEVTETNTAASFEQFDANQDGMLSFEEYRIGRESRGEDDPTGSGMGGMGS
ncbi:hypothetical protein N9060_02045 [Arenicella sp.]|nr:hypothetical protein [Arenicella sp.]